MGRIRMDVAPSNPGHIWVGTNFKLDRLHESDGDYSLFLPHYIR